MHSGDLPITGRHAVVTLTLFGVGAVTVPYLYLLIAVAVVLVVGGALLVRAGFRRRQVAPTR